MGRNPVSIPTLAMVISVAGGTDQTTALAGDRPAESLLKEGLHQEQTLRRPELAVATYRKVIDAGDASPAVRAEAHLRLGFCLERMGRTEQAREQFELVVRRFGNHGRLIDRARRRLAVISAGDPAMLMPPETLLYVELVRPGLQAERFVASLKGLDQGGLDRLLKRFRIDRRLRNVRALLTEGVREDLNRIDSLALGLISQEELPGRTDFKFLLVLHPGKSVAARGSLFLMVQSAGTPSGEYAETTLWDIPDEDGGAFTFANLSGRPGLSGAMILGKDRQVVCQAIDRWRAGPKAGGLSSLPEFRRQAAVSRVDSAVLAYADVPRILARLQRDMAPNQRTRYETGRQLLALDAIERGMARVALLDNRVLFELSIMFNEKANPFYAMLRTPPADRTLLGFIPTNTASAYLMSMGQGRDKWARIEAFLKQLAGAGRAAGGLGLSGIAGAIGEAEALLGLSVAEDLMDNCRSLAVIVPTLAPSGSESTNSFAANIVLVLRMLRPDEFARRLDASLLDRLRMRMAPGQIAGVQTRTYVDTPAASGAALAVARIGDVFLITLSSEMLERVLRAYQRGDVMARSSLGRPAVAAVPTSASKIVLLRPELVINDIRARRGQAPLKLRPVRPVVAYTLEQPRQAALRVEIGGLTGLLNNLVLAAGTASPTSIPASPRAVASRPGGRTGAAAAPPLP